MRKTLYKNSISGILQLIFVSALTFISVTIFIKYLGAEIYGLFSVISLIGNINVFTGLGLNSSLVKYISEQGKIKESHMDIAVTLFITFFMLTLLSITALFFSKYILLNIFYVPVQYFDISKRLYLCLIISNLFGFLGQTFNSVIDSQHRIFLTNILQMIYNFLYVGSMILIILLGYSIDIIGIGIMFSAIVWFVLVVIFFFKVWGKLQIKGLKSDFFRIAKKQVSYGLRIYASGIIGIFYEPLTKIIISHFLGIKEVGYFDMVLKVKNQLQNLIGKAYYPIYPLIAQTKEFFKLRKIVHDIEQKVFIILPPVLSSVILCASPFTKIWLGDNTDLIVDGIIIITIAHIIASFTIIPFYIYLLVKKASVTVLIQLTNVFVNTTLLILTYKLWGFYSVYFASSIAIISSFIVSMYYQKKYLKSLIFDSLTQVFKVIIIFIACLFTGYLTSLLIEANLVKLIVIPVVNLLISVITLRFLQILKVEDLQRYLNENTGLYRLSSKVFIKS